MLIVGLDAAAQFANFGYAVADFDGERIRNLRCGCIQDETHLETDLVERVRTAGSALIAVDAPLGWPLPFADALRTHSAGDVIAVPANALFRRHTDDFLANAVGKRSLDVGADKIARAAWRALDVLGRLRILLCDPIPLAWQPIDLPRLSAIEVYPAATLLAHGISKVGYKKKEAFAARSLIAAGFSEVCPALVRFAHGSVDAFDAALCIVAGVDFVRGDAMPPADLVRARREGWIWCKAPSRLKGDAPGKN